MEKSPFLPLLEGLCMTQILQEETRLTVEVTSERLSSSCPLCAQTSVSVHSHYMRMLRDVPCGGCRVRLRLLVQKFFCRNPLCQQKIFTERLPTFVEPWAQMTLRLNRTLQMIGLATCGSLGARLAAHLGISVSWMTIVRRIMNIPTPAAGLVTVVGIDDFSFRRGRTFGTILVDLDRHQVIDLLNERSSKSSATWMHTHPELEYVSRDRGNDYTQGANEGAPQAIQVADRFHVTKNLVESIEPVVARCYKYMRHAQPPLPSPVLPQPREWRQASDSDAERKRVARLTENQDRFEQVKALHLRGLKQEEIARRLGMAMRTVQRWLERGTCPGNQRRRKRRSIFDPYAPYILRRWQEGCRDVSLLWQEIQNQGFSGEIRTVYRFIRALRQESIELPNASVLDRVSVQEAIWLIVRPPDDLKADERTECQELCQASQELSTLYALVQSFGQIVRKREGHRLGDWMKQVAQSGISEVQRFVKGLERDKEAVLAGLTVIYSNGQVEGQVNKLKLLKRTMYGRAGFPLLRQRVLHAL